MSVDDVLNDSIDVQDNVEAMLQAILNGQNAIMDRITEVERQQTTLKDKAKKQMVERHDYQTCRVSA